MLPIQPPLIRSFFTGKKTVVSPEFHEAFFLSWEDALWQLLRFHRIKSGSTVLVPSFFCWDVVENMRAHGLSPVIYEIDKFLQPNRADFEAKLRTKLPTVIVLFHAVGISNPLLQDTNWLKMVPKNTIIIEDAVHRVIDPSQVTLIAPNHYLIDSLRKVSPLQGSRVFSQHLVPQPTMIDTLQTAGYRIKVLVWWLVMQIWLLLAYWAKQKTFQRFANRQAEIAMQRGYDLIGDHRLPSSAPRLFQALATRLNLDLIKQTNHQQAKLYHQLLENLWTKPGIIKIPMKQADWQELRGFPVGLELTIAPQLLAKLRSSGILLRFELNDSPWSKKQKVIYLPMGLHITTENIRQVCETILNSCYDAPMQSASPTTIYFVRHGQKQLHRDDPGLTELGKSQAQSTGSFLKQFPITRIIASPLKRTQETAEQIAHQLKLAVEINEALVERMEWPAEAVTKQQFSQEWVKATNNRTYVPQWGTSSEDTGKRIADLLSEHADSGEHILIVSHGGAIVDSLRTMFGDAPLESLKRTYDEGTDFLMLNCAITQVILESPPQLKLLHYTDHLQQVSE